MSFHKLQYQVVDRSHARERLLLWLSEIGDGISGDVETQPTTHTVFPSHAVVRDRAMIWDLLIILLFTIYAEEFHHIKATHRQQIPNAPPVPIDNPVAVRAVETWSGIPKTYDFDTGLTYTECEMVEQLQSLQSLIHTSLKISVNFGARNPSESYAEQQFRKELRGLQEIARWSSGVQSSHMITLISQLLSSRRKKRRQEG